jgi:hypothetical protein
MTTILAMAPVVQVVFGIILAIGVMSCKRGSSTGGQAAVVFFLTLFAVVQTWYIAAGALCVAFVVVQAFNHLRAGAPQPSLSRKS